MAGQKVEVLVQILSESSLKKLTAASQDVFENKICHFPSKLLEEGKADLKFVKDGNGEILPGVTVSLQSVSTAPRLVFLQKGWKKIVEELHLRKGDKLTIFLIDRSTWTYSVQVEKAGTAEHEAEANFGGHVAEIDKPVAGAAEGAIVDTSGLKLRADCAVKKMEETSNKRPSFDLNGPPMDMHEAEANFGGHVAEIDKQVAGAAEGAIPDLAGLQLLADWAVKKMEETSNQRPSFDLNRQPMDTEF